MSNFALKILDVLDPGSPNLERIAIYATSHCDLREYVLLIGHRNMDGSATPIKDNMLWFGAASLNPGDWIYIYTAQGQTTTQLIEGTSSKLHSIHWGKDHTVFQNGALIPMLCQISSIAMPSIPLPLAHTKQINSY
ncbi:hypothetical protein HKD51_01065 [Pseudomonas fragi]|nr:hypothetical protein [Pseudomonas sp. GC01]